MLPVLFLGLGVALIASGLLVLRRLGRAYRIGRLLTAAPLVPVAAAIELARSGEPRYVRVHGRITSVEEFPDELERPLVFRRRRLQLRSNGRWQDVWHEREAVPFGVEERAAYIAVDADRLEHGLVVLPREARGRAAEVAEHLPAGTDPVTATRLHVDQISAVEQADVAGRPMAGPDGSPMMTAGLGRPLIVSTLAQPEAMRVLGAEHAGRVRLAAALLAAGAFSVGLAIVTAAAVWTLGGSGLIGVARAATSTQPPPSPATSTEPSTVPSPADTRSSGAGPGLVGQPFLAVLIVIGVAAVAVGAAAGYARLSAGRDAPDEVGPDG